MKWGIIKICIDDLGNVIPKQEKLIVLFIYDRVNSSNLKTATIYYNNKLSYIDLDKSKYTYGKQLVPLVLEHAVLFDVKFKDFAECSV